MSAWAPAVYVLCLLTSAACAWLLLKGYFRNRSQLLLWSGVCFLLLTLNNLFVIIDLLVFPNLTAINVGAFEINLGLARSLSQLAAVLTLLYGFIWEID